MIEWKVIDEGMSVEVVPMYVPDVRDGELEIQVCGVFHIRVKGQTTNTFNFNVSNYGPAINQRAFEEMTWPNKDVIKIVVEALLIGLYAGVNSDKKVLMGMREVKTNVW